MRNKKSSKKNMGKYASLPQIASLLQVEPRWINRLVKEQGFPREARGQYDITKCVHWYINDLRRQVEENKGGSLKSAKERKENAYAERAELEAAEKRGELIKVDDIVPLLEKIVLTIKTNMNRQPKRLAPKVMLAKDIKGCEKIIELDVNQVFNELSNIKYEPGKEKGTNQQGSLAKRK